MIRKELFTELDAGFYIDDTYGLTYVRNTLAEILNYVKRNAYHEDDYYIEEIIQSLEKDPPDDLSDMDSAEEILNRYTAENCHWMMDNGGLFLVKSNGEYLI